MPLLLLIRHAETASTGKILSGWTPGVHLSEMGRKQAEELPGRLAALRISELYSSPLERCIETATPLARSANAKLRRSASLGEVRYGDWEGKPLSRLARTKLWREVQTRPATARFPGGETLLEVQSRAVAAARRITEEHPRATIAVVSHGDVIRLLLAHFAGIHIDLFQRIALAPASVSAVFAGDGGPRILRLNDTGSLEDLAPRRRRGGT